jgi:hypothetical protein
MKNEKLRIAAGLFLPSGALFFLYFLFKSFFDKLSAEDESNAWLMLVIINLIVASGVVTAYFFKGIAFKKNRDKLLVWANVWPFILFIVFFPQFKVIIPAVIIGPILGFWFGKRYFNL